jgi:hypothetical protein
MAVRRGDSFSGSACTGNGTSNAANPMLYTMIEKSMQKKKTARMGLKK